MSNTFVQIHLLLSQSAALLNRDDSGQAKTACYGGVTRTRISSQCLKRNWRKNVAFDEVCQRLGVDRSTRSRLIFDQMASNMTASGINEAVARQAALTLRDLLLGTYKKKAKATAAAKKVAKTDGATDPAPVVDGTGTPADMSATMLLGTQEIKYLHGIAVTMAKKIEGGIPVDQAVEEAIPDLSGNTSENLKSIALAGVDAAIFGRMVTGDTLAGATASLSVAHALTVGAAQVESDMFTVVDDLSTDNGAAHLAETPLTSGTFYIYACVDVGQLAHNVGDKDIANKLTAALIGLIPKASVGAKKGSTAPQAWAGTVLVEVGADAPRSLMGAFESPVSPQDGLAGAAQRLCERLEDLDAMYGTSETIRFMATIERNKIGPVAERAGITVLSIPAIQERVMAALTGAA